MRRAALLIAFCVTSLSACLEPADQGDAELFCEVQTGVLVAPRPMVDLVLVIDDSSAMTSYASALESNLGRWAKILEWVEGGLPSLQLGVVSADLAGGTGAFENRARVPNCQPPAGAYLYDDSLPWWMCGDDPSARCGESNYVGELADATRCVGLLGSEGVGPQQPLAAAVRALDGTVPGNAGFIREDAILMVVVVAATDDASIGSVAEYAAELRALKRDPLMVTVAVVAPDSAPRLNALAEHFPQRQTRISIDSEDWSEAFILVANAFTRVLGVGCLPYADPSDVDPNAPGIQLECVASATDGATEQESILQPCRMEAAGQPARDTHLPCYWIEPDPTFPECDHIPRIEGGHFRDSYHIRCVGTCGG